MECTAIANTRTPLLLTAFAPLPVSRTMANDAIDFQVIHPQFGPTAQGPSYLAIRARAEFDATLQSFTTATPRYPSLTLTITRCWMATRDRNKRGYSIVFSSVHEVRPARMRRRRVPTDMDPGPAQEPRINAPGSRLR